MTLRSAECLIISFAHTELTSSAEHTKHTSWHLVPTKGSVVDPHSSNMDNSVLSLHNIGKSVIQHNAIPESDYLLMKELQYSSAPQRPSKLNLKDKYMYSRAAHSLSLKKAPEISTE